MDMNKIEKAIKGILVASALATTGAAIAATDGTLGLTSTGTVNITVSTGDQIQISGMVDIVGGHVVGSDFVGTTPVCIYKNGADNTFRINADSNFAGGGFNLADGGGANPVAYTVNYFDGAGNTTAMVENTDVAVDNANDQATDCSSGNAAQTFTITAADAALQAVPAGTYTDTLTILVTPN